MTPNEIELALCDIVLGLNSANTGNKEKMEASVIGARDLITNFLVNQQRIADSLVKLADCVRPPNGYAVSEFEVRVYDNQ